MWVFHFQCSLLGWSVQQWPGITLQHETWESCHCEKETLSKSTARSVETRAGGKERPTDEWVNHKSLLLCMVKPVRVIMHPDWKALKETERFGCCNLCRLCDLKTDPVAGLIKLGTSIRQNKVLKQSNSKEQHWCGPLWALNFTISPLICIPKNRWLSKVKAWLLEYVPV